MGGWRCLPWCAITNYFGWYLTGMLIFQLFALYLHRLAPIDL